MHLEPFQHIVESRRSPEYCLCMGRIDTLGIEPGIAERWHAAINSLEGRNKSEWHMIYLVILDQFKAKITIMPHINTPSINNH